MKNLNIPLNSNELIELNYSLIKAEQSLSYLHGLFCAVNTSPNIIMPSRWQAIVFDDLECDSEQEFEQTVVLICRFYNSVGKNLRDNNFKPLLYQEPNNLLEEVVSARDWSVGYLRGVQIDNSWDNLAKSDKMMQTFLIPVIFLASLSAFKNEVQVAFNVQRKDIVEAIDKLKHMNQVLYITLQEIRKEMLNSNLDYDDYQPYRSNRQGRNELCACGSGKKYKKCCLELDQSNSVSSLISER